MLSSGAVDFFRIGGICFFALATLGFGAAATVLRTQRQRIQCILALPSMLALLIYYAFAKNDATSVLRTGDGKFVEQGLWLALAVYAFFDTLSVSIMTALSKVQGIAAAVVATGAAYLFFLAARCDIYGARWAAFSLGIVLVAYWLYHQWVHSRALRRTNVDADGQELSDPLQIAPLGIVIIVVAMLWTALVLGVAAVGLAGGPGGKGNFSANDSQAAYFTATLMVLVGGMAKVALDRDPTVVASA